MNQSHPWSRRWFLHAFAAAPAAWLVVRTAAGQAPSSPATADIELEVPAVGEAPPLRLLGKRVFNCYKYLANIALRQPEELSAEERNFVDMARQLDRSLDPFGLGMQNYFEFGMIEAASETELLTGLERQARLFSTGVAAAIAQALELYEKEVWPRHRALIQESLSPLTKHFGSASERLVSTQAARLGYQKFPPQLTVNLIVSRLLRGSYSHPTVVSLADVQGSELIERVLDELIHVSAFENADAPGTAEVLLDSALTRKQVPRRARAQLWHLLDSWSAGELVRERVDPAYVPYAVRQRLFESVHHTYNLKVSEALFRAIWQNYQQGKIDLSSAMRQLADAVL